MRVTDVAQLAPEGADEATQHVDLRLQRRNLRTRRLGGRTHIIVTVTVAHFALVFAVRLVVLRITAVVVVVLLLILVTVTTTTTILVLVFIFVSPFVLAVVLPLPTSRSV